MATRKTPDQPAEKPSSPGVFSGAQAKKEEPYSGQYKGRSTLDLFEEVFAVNKSGPTPPLPPSKEADDATK